MADTMKHVAFQEGEAKRKSLEEVKAAALERLTSRLAPLTSKSYYKDHLDLSPANLRRWLDDSHHGVLMAEARLRASIGIRRSVNIPELSGDDMPHTLKHHLGGGTCGTDRQGSPVYFHLFGKTDTLGLVQSSTRDQMVCFWSFLFQNMMDHLQRKSKQEGNAVHNILLIVDMHGSTTSHFRWPVISAWAQVLQLFQDLCPALFKEILLIHPPLALPLLHKVLASYLRRSTRELITVIQQADCLNHLLQRLEKHEIPAYLGGYKCDVDADPYCCQDLVWPRKVPRWAYLTDPRLPADVTHTVVAPGDVTTQEIQVPCADSRITWQLFDVTHPITLRVMAPVTALSDGSETAKSHPLYTSYLKDTDRTHEGSVIVHRPGTHTLVLDNKKDLAHTVRAKVKLDVVLPPKFWARYTRSSPLGDSINFSAPVSVEERTKRTAMIKASKDFRFLEKKHSMLEW